MKSFTRLISILLAASIAAATVSACNTVKGVGRDVQSVGEAGEDALDRNR